MHVVRKTETQCSRLEVAGSSSDHSCTTTERCITDYRQVPTVNDAFCHTVAVRPLHSLRNLVWRQDRCSATPTVAQHFA